MGRLRDWTSTALPSASDRHTSPVLGRRHCSQVGHSARPSRHGTPRLPFFPPPEPRRNSRSSPAPLPEQGVDCRAVKRGQRHPSPLSDRESRRHFRPQSAPRLAGLGCLPSPASPLSARRSAWTSAALLAPVTVTSGQPWASIPAPRSVTRQDSAAADSPNLAATRAHETPPAPEHPATFRRHGSAVERGWWSSVAAAGSVTGRPSTGEPVALLLWLSGASGRHGPPVGVAVRVGRVSHSALALAVGMLRFPFFPGLPGSASGDTDPPNPGAARRRRPPFGPDLR